MTDLIVLMITLATIVIFAGKRIPSFLRKLGKGLREMKFTDNGYVEIDR